MAGRNLSDFALPGEFTVAESALSLAQAFETRLIIESKAKGMLVGFDWADSRRVRAPGTNNWEDWGAGIDVAALPVMSIPAEAVIYEKGFSYFIRVPKHVRDGLRAKFIERKMPHAARLAIT